MFDGSRFYTPPSAREPIARVENFGDITPKKIMASTSSALGDYFGDSSRREIPGVLRTIIARDSYPFMKLVALGAALDLDKTRKLSKEDTKYTLNFMKPLEHSDPSDTAVEAFRVALVTLANMPDMVARKYPSDGSVLKRNAVKPSPQTTTELLGRLAEIQEVLRELYWGMIPRNFDGQTKTVDSQERILRTLLFFEVGNDLPLKKIDDSKKTLPKISEGFQDISERDAFNDFLKGIEIDL